MTQIHPDVLRRFARIIIREVTGDTLSAMVTGELGYRSDTHELYLAGYGGIPSVIVGGGAVDSVNGKIGTVVLVAHDISGFANVATSGAYADLSGRPVVPAPSTAAPVMNGAAAPGTSLLYARQDHVHPTDTTLAPKHNPLFDAGAGFWGHAPPAARPATPVTLADAIAVLQAYGLCA